MILNPILALSMPFIVFFLLVFMVFVPIVKRVKSMLKQYLYITPILLICGAASTFYMINILEVIILNEEEGQYTQYMVIGSTSYTLADQSSVTLSRKETPEDIKTIVINDSTHFFSYDQITYMAGMNTPLDFMVGQQSQMLTQTIKPYSVFNSPHKDIFVLRDPLETISSDKGLEKRGWIHESE